MISVEKNMRKWVFKKKMDLEMVETWVISLLWGSWFQFLSAMGFENSILIYPKMWDSKSQNEDSYATRTRIKTEKVEHNLDQIWILVAASPKLGAIRSECYPVYIRICCYSS